MGIWSEYYGRYINFTKETQNKLLVEYEKVAKKLNISTGYENRKNVDLMEDSVLLDKVLLAVYSFGDKKVVEEITKEIAGV